MLILFHPSHSVLFFLFFSTYFNYAIQLIVEKREYKNYLIFITFLTEYEFIDPPHKEIIDRYREEVFSFFFIFFFFNYHFSFF